MKRLFVLGLAALLLGGCGGALKSAPPTQVAPAAPAPGSTPSATAPAQPAADPLAAIKAYCAKPPAGQETSIAPLFVTLLRDVPPERAEQVLTDAQQHKAFCFTFSVAKAGEPLIVVGNAPLGGASVLWRQGTGWASQEIPDLGEMEDILLQRQDAQGREVYLRSGNLGTGVFGRFSVLRLEAAGWRVLFKSPTFEKMGVKALNDTWVLVTGRNIPGDIPLINSANCCAPIDYQWLYKRDGDTFKLAAERRAPDPAFTINVFMGAVRNNHQQWLSKLGSPQAAATARKLGLAELQVGWADEPAPKPGDPGVRAAELAHWDALPPELNGPAPDQSTLTFKAKVPNSTSTAVMTIKRLADRWFIESITEQKP